MTTTVEMLDSIKHRKLKINAKHYNCQQNQVNVASVVVSELSTLTHEYPIFITKNSITGQFQLSAILGFTSQENLFLKGKKWQATYLPLDILRRPFQLIQPDKNSTAQGHLAIDMSSEQLQSKSGEKLFDTEGEPTEYLQRIQQSFSQLIKGSALTQDILSKADEFGLLEPITINIELEGEKGTSLTGLYTFNQKAVTELKGKALEDCHNNSVLQVCHLLLSSGLHLEKLIKWKNKSLAVNN